MSSLSKPDGARGESEKPRQKERGKEQRTEENKEGHLYESTLLIRIFLGVLVLGHWESLSFPPLNCNVRP